MLAVRSHWPFATLYDNQINYVIRYLRHDATFSEILFDPLFSYF